MRHLKPNVRLRESGIAPCSGCGAVRGQTSLPVSYCAWFCGWGAAESHTRKVIHLPTLRGVSPQSPHQPRFADLLGARAEEILDTLSYSLRIPWIVTAVVVNPHTRVSRLLSNRLSGKTQPKSSLKALTFMPFSCE